jgi:nucleotide-binding universal stress UspA family protein
MVEPSALAEPSRIVVGVDGSEPSLRALSWARYLAERTGSRIEAVGAWELPAAWAPGLLPVPVDIDLGPATEAMLTEAVATAFGDDQPANLSMTVHLGRAGDILLQVSEAATMLVVGSRGHGAVAGLFLGSVSKTCIEGATCPVLVVHEATPAPPGT